MKRCVIMAFRCKFNYLVKQGNHGFLGVKLGLL
jgi:hypothetical protein